MQAAGFGDQLRTIVEEHAERPRTTRVDAQVGETAIRAGVRVLGRRTWSFWWWASEAGASEPLMRIAIVARRARWIVWQRRYAVLDADGITGLDVVRAARRALRASCRHASDPAAVRVTRDIYGWSIAAPACPECGEALHAAVQQRVGELGVPCSIHTAHEDVPGGADAGER
jgi:hypothetical protein